MTRTPPPSRVPPDDPNGGRAGAPPGTASIYVVRHGRTALNAAGALRGHLDPPLDEAGEAEAEGLGELLSAAGLGVVVSSPLRRAVQTATAIARRHGLAVTAEPGLIDRDYGPWAGRRRADIERDHGPLDELPGVEPLTEVAARVTAAFQRLAGVAASRPLVAVAHDIVNRVLLADLCPERFPSPDDVPQRTGCWNRLELGADGWGVTVVDAVTAG